MPRIDTAGDATGRATNDPGLARSGWQAHLSLAFECRDGETILRRREHRGPLVVQKALHPEGRAVCQAIVVHPPGGIAGGDDLVLDLTVGEQAHVQVTTPGAAKWYRSSGAPARQVFSAQVAAGAFLEWLPQEAIVFDGAVAEQAIVVRLASDARFVGWDVTVLGRRAAGESFDRGRVRQRFELVRNGALVWTERTVLDGADPLLASAVGLAGATIFGTFVASAPEIADDLLAACRKASSGVDDGTECAVTRLPGVLVGRCRGRAVPSVRAALEALWVAVRPALCGRVAVVPRIWST